MNNYLSFNDKVALVTGASSGMGLATAQAFAEAGASVVLADFKEEAVRKAAEKLVNEDHRALAIHCDVSNDAQVEAMVERTVAEFRPAGAQRTSSAGENNSHDGHQAGFGPKIACGELPNSSGE